MSSPGEQKEATEEIKVNRKTESIFYS